MIWMTRKLLSGEKTPNRLKACCFVNTKHYTTFCPYYTTKMAAKVSETAQAELKFDMIKYVMDL